MRPVGICQYCGGRYWQSNVYGQQQCRVCGKWSEKSWLDEILRAVGDYTYRP